MKTYYAVQVNINGNWRYVYRDRQDPHRLRDVPFDMLADWDENILDATVFRHYAQSFFFGAATRLTKRQIGPVEVVTRMESE